jgi:hypothetical protein
MRGHLTGLLVAVAAFAGELDRASVAAADDGRTAEPTPRPEANGQLDACALLTRADVTEVVGEEPRKPKPAETAPQLPGSEMVGSTCQYSGEGWRLRFFVERGHTEASRKTARPAFKGWQTVRSVGDEAWWGQADPSKPGTMSAFSGSHALVLNWFVRGGKVGPGSLENSAELMRRAVTRL